MPTWLAQPLRSLSRIIHMNGRIYDPTIGRFLQADPHIQAPMNSQNYNRYSYVLNNPMSYTDPSGYFFKKMLRGIAKVQILNAVVQLALGAVCQGAAAVCLAAYNGMQSYAVTGNIGASVKSAYITLTSAAVFSAIGGKFKGDVGAWNATNGPLHIASHALAGGVISELQGGKFGHGFFSAGLTKGFHASSMVSDNAFVGSVQSAIVGGTASVITGGKFSYGAVTVAFQFLYNYCKTAKKCSFSFTDGKSPNDYFKENYKEGRIQTGSRYKRGNVSIENGIVTRTFNTPATGPLEVSVDSNNGVEAALATSLDLKIAEPGAKVFISNNGIVGTEANVRIGSSEFYINYVAPVVHNIEVWATTVNEIFYQSSKSPIQH